MKNNIRFNQNFLVITVSLIASYLVSASPSKAATFSYSETSLIFTDFSQVPSDTFSQSDVDIISTSQDGQVVTQSEATAIINKDSRLGINSSFSLASGQNDNYMGLATSQSQIKGTFNVQQDTLFSFNFIVDLKLFASIDRVPREHAQSSGEVHFALMDIHKNTTLDMFTARSYLNVRNEKDFVYYEKEGGIEFLEHPDNPIILSSFGGLQEYSQVSITGSYERYFDKQTTLALVAMTNNRVKVSAPEPSSQLALLLTGGILLIGIKWKRRHEFLVAYRGNKDSANQNSRSG